MSEPIENDSTKNNIFNINSTGRAADVVHCGECEFNNVYDCKHPQGLKYCATPDCSCEHGKRMGGL